MVHFPSCGALRIPCGKILKEIMMPNTCRSSRQKCLAFRRAEEQLGALASAHMIPMHHIIAAGVLQPL